MPYILPDQREFLDPWIKNLSEVIKANRKLGPGKDSAKGHLNYVITSLLVDIYLEDLCYDNINDIVGVLECVKQEFYRRAAIPLENTKITVNGDVYY